MTIYWFLFFTATFFSILGNKQNNSLLLTYKWSFSWKFIFIFLVLIIGLRHEVGGDWYQYLWYVENSEGLSFEDSLNTYEPAFSILNLLASKLNLGVYFVNFIFAIIFSLGLLSFCRIQNRPWLAVLVCVPYLITVVGMGYSRQAVAIGLVMIGFINLFKENTFKFIINIFVAALFHKTALILIPFFLLTKSNNKKYKFIIICFIIIILYTFISIDYLESLKIGYIDSEYESTGATIRVSMNSVPAIIFLIYKNNFKLSAIQRNFWFWMSCSAILFIPLLFFSPSSTAIDRIALYWIPIQIVVWSGLPSAVPHRLNLLCFYFIIIYCFLIYLVWLNYSNHSFLWIPYQFYPWVFIWQ